VKKKKKENHKCIIKSIGSIDKIATFRQGL